MFLSYQSTVLAGGLDIPFRLNGDLLACFNINHPLKHVGAW